MMYTFKFQDQIYKIKLEEEGKQTEIEIAGNSEANRQSSFAGKKIPLEFQKIDESFYSIIVDGKSIGVEYLRKGKGLRYSWVETFMNLNQSQREKGRYQRGLSQGFKR